MLELLQLMATLIIMFVVSTVATLLVFLCRLAKVIIESRQIATLDLVEGDYIILRNGEIGQIDFVDTAFIHFDTGFEIEQKYKVEVGKVLRDKKWRKVKLTFLEKQLLKSVGHVD